MVSGLEAQLCDEFVSQNNLRGQHMTNMTYSYELSTRMLYSRSKPHPSSNHSIQLMKTEHTARKQNNKMESCHQSRASKRALSLSLLHISNSLSVSLSLPTASAMNSIASSRMLLPCILCFKIIRFFINQVFHLISQP